MGSSVFYLFYAILEYLYMNYFYRKTLREEIFTYENNGRKQEATIYKTSNGPKKSIILFLSGSYSISYDAYIKKTVFDLQTKKEIMDKYQLIVYEKLDKSSICMYDDISLYLETIDMDELIIVGFSSGGVIASHVMNRLNSRNIKKKIITYDTPWQIQDNVSSFGNNLFYRMDLYCNWIVYNVYLNHYNYSEIKPILMKSRWFHGAEKMISMIKSIHNYTDEQMYSATGWNWDLPSDVKVINIYCSKDPLVNRGTHENYVRTYGKNKRFHIYNLKKNVIGHCTDMGYNRRYLGDIIRAIHT